MSQIMQNEWSKWDSMSPNKNSNIKHGTYINYQKFLTVKFLSHKFRALDFGQNYKNSVLQSEKIKSPSILDLLKFGQLGLFRNYKCSEFLVINVYIEYVTTYL